MEIVHAEKYYKQIQERYPYLSEKQIDKIVKYGLRSFFAHNKFGADILLKSHYYTAYVGKLFNQVQLFAVYRIIKMKLKLRIKYKRSKQQFNGKYYFGLKKEQWEELYGGNKKKNKILYLNDVRIFKLYDECALYKFDYIYEFPYNDVGFSKKFDKLKIPRYNLIAKRNKDGIIKPVGKWRNK